MIQVGDRVKVTDQDIFGIIIYDYGNEVIIEDEYAEKWNRNGRRHNRRRLIRTILN